MLDGYENRLAYCAAFGSMTFELTSILYSPYGRFTSFAIGHAVKDNQLIKSAPVLRSMCSFINEINDSSYHGSCLPNAIMKTKSLPVSMCH